MPRWVLVLRTVLILIGGLAAIVALSACSGAAADTVTAGPPAGARGAALPPSAAAPAPRPATSGSQSGAAPASSTLLAQGRKVFEETAGGVGCAYCHGHDGKGTGPAGLQAAFIQDKKEVDIRYAMANLPMMSIVKLNDQEVEAVAAYVQTLKDQYP